jgi:shikimate kinase
MTQPIFLVGPRGCGKSTVGLELSRVCHSQFVDTDHWLQTHAGQSIAEIVEQEGWASFRARETATLEAVTAPSTVIATEAALFWRNIIVSLCAKKGL